MILDVRSLGVHFGAFHAVSDVTLALGAGDLLGLVGPNGAGKTTLLRAVSCLQEFTGAVSVLGMNVEPGRPDVMRHFGFTPDYPPVYEQLTVREFLQFIGRGYELSASETQERIDFWLDRVWLIEKADQKIKQLSRGMRQRVGIARTLMSNPSVILLDEPAAGLDPAGRVQFRQLLVSLREQGKALIVSSHILADMDAYCSHVGVMSAGRLVQFGTVADFTAAMMSQTHGVGAARSRYRVEFAEPVGPQTTARLSAIEGVSGAVAQGPSAITFDFDADAHAARRLLASLVGELQLPVAEFRRETANLEDAYLRAGVRQVD